MGSRQTDEVVSGEAGRLKLRMLLPWKLTFTGHYEKFKLLNSIRLGSVTDLDPTSKFFTISGIMPTNRLRSANQELQAFIRSRCDQARDGRENIPCIPSRVS